MERELAIELYISDAGLQAELIKIDRVASERGSANGNLFLKSTVYADEAAVRSLRIAAVLNKRTDCTTHHSTYAEAYGRDLVNRAWC
ncbi:MAG: hypothetical protein WDN50_05515 [Bradyrhizobium sp.]